MSETLSRTELLTERSYPDDIIHTNGSTSAPVERVCAVCDGPIPAERPQNSQTCGDECRNEWRLRQRRRNHHEGREPPGDVMELLMRSRAGSASRSSWVGNAGDRPARARTSSPPLHLDLLQPDVQ